MMVMGTLRLGSAPGRCWVLSDAAAGGEAGVGGTVDVVAAAVAAGRYTASKLGRRRSM